MAIKLKLLLLHLTYIGRCGAFSKNASINKKIYLPDVQYKTQKRKLDGKIPVRSRNIPIGIDDLKEITIWELDKPSKLMDLWWSADLDSSAAVKKEKIGDPFGVIMWPGSILASKELANHRGVLIDSTVLILGAGTGVEAQAAAKLGARKVIALDIANLSLKLLKFGATQACVGDIIKPVQFDLFSKEKLPDCDIVVAADVMYNEDIAMQIGERCVELLTRENPPKLIITDSQRFHGTDFLDGVNLRLEGKCEHVPLQWECIDLENFRGSGVMIDGDQTYDATTRMVSVGW